MIQRMMGLCNRLRRLFSRYNNYYKARVKGFLGMTLSLRDVIIIGFSPKHMREFSKYIKKDSIFPNFETDKMKTFSGTMKVPGKKV